VIEKKDLMHFLASRPEVEKVIRGRMAQAKTEKLGNPLLNAAFFSHIPLLN